MLTYTVRYKLQGSWFWKTVRNVTADGLDNSIPVRWLFINDARFEIPIAGTLFWFSKERMSVIRKNIEAKAEQEKAAAQQDVTHGQ